MVPLRNDARATGNESPGERLIRSSVYLSVAVPGLGQLVQRRWCAGFFFLVAFLALMGAMVATVLRALVINWLAALSFAQSPSAEVSLSVPVVPLLALLSLALVVYTWAVIDAWRAQGRIVRSRRGQ